MLEMMVREVEHKLISMDGQLTDQVRVRLGLERIVAYFRAAKMQQTRLSQWLYEPDKKSVAAKSFPLDQGAALCEAHFLFTCWDSIYKTAADLRQNCYGLKVPRVVLKKYRLQFRKYQNARDHLEHLTERLPGQPRSDWRGDQNSVTGTVAGIRRDGFFVFQGEEWDVAESSTALLNEIVSELVEGIHLEVDSLYEGYLRGESAMRSSHHRVSASLLGRSGV